MAQSNGFFFLFSTILRWSPMGGYFENTSLRNVYEGRRADLWAQVPSAESRWVWPASLLPVSRHWEYKNNSREPQVAQQMVVTPSCTAFLVLNGMLPSWALTLGPWQKRQVQLGTKGTLITVSRAHSLSSESNSGTPNSNHLAGTTRFLSGSPIWAPLILTETYSMTQCWQSSLLGPTKQDRQQKF